MFQKRLYPPIKFISVSLGMSVPTRVCLVHVLACRLTCLELSRLACQPLTEEESLGTIASRQCRTHLYTTIEQTRNMRPLT